MKVCSLHYAPYYYWARFNRSTAVYSTQKWCPNFTNKLFYVAHLKCPRSSLYIKDITWFYLKAGGLSIDYYLQQPILNNNGEYLLQLGILLYHHARYNSAYKAFSNCINLSRMIQYEMYILQWFSKKLKPLLNYNPYFCYGNKDANIEQLKFKIVKLESKYGNNINLSLGVLYYNLGEYYMNQSRSHSTKINEKVNYYLNLAKKHNYISQAILNKRLQEFYTNQRQHEKEIQLLYQMDTCELNPYLYILFLFESYII